MIEEVLLDEFRENELLKRASCMTVINIGELVKNLSEDIKTKYREMPWKLIAGFRDIAAHKYQTLHMEDVFETIDNDFEELEMKIEEILNKEKHTG